MGLRGPKAKPVSARFASKTRAADNGCIEWTAGTNGVGYGVIRLGPEDHHLKMYAHRYAYEQAFGAIPDGLHLDHLCRNTLCVNPEHLEAVTLEVNVLRGLSSPARNARKTHCMRGHQFTAENTYITPTSGYRHCRECARERDRQRKSRRRQSQARKAS